MLVRPLLVKMLVVLSFCGWANAETVELRNGDVIHGTVLSLDAKDLHLRSESFGDLTISRETVATIHLREQSVTKNAKASPKTQSVLDKVQSPADVIKQLQADGGISAADMKAVQQKLPLMAMPEVKGFVGDRLSGLLTGRLDILDIRTEAIDAVDQIKDLQKDLGPQASALNGYLSILENFIRETDPGTDKKSEAIDKKDAPPTAKEPIR